MVDSLLCFFQSVQRRVKCTPTRMHKLHKLCLRTDITCFQRTLIHVPTQPYHMRRPTYATAAESPERAYIASSSGDAVFAASRFELAAQLQPLRTLTDRCRHTAALRLFERPGAEKLMVRFANDVSLAHVMYLVHEHEVLHRYAHGRFV